jgi:hypothetical protein
MVNICHINLIFLINHNHKINNKMDNKIVKDKDKVKVKDKDKLVVNLINNNYNSY